jgi:tetratricopeptide (TPR) repeat protein
MNWFSNLFKKKSNDTSNTIKSESKKKLTAGYHAFIKGKQCYLNNQKSEALQYFDLAIENGFVEDNVYSLRGGCLQQQNYHYDAIDDFNKAIILSPKDCNIYFMRSVSKGAVLDFEGQVADLEKAINLSLEDNELNKVYHDEANKLGYEDGVTGMFEMKLLNANLDLETEIKRKEMELNGSTEIKEIFQEMKSKKLSNIKRRSK